MLRLHHVVGVSIEPGKRILVGEDGSVSLYLTDAERQRLLASGSSLKESVAAGENGEVVVPLPTSPMRLEWYTHRDPVLLATWSGIVAGFDDLVVARQFLARRNPKWVSERVMNRFWSREGRHWVWVDTGLVPHLVNVSCPLPLLKHDGANLT